MVLRKSKLITGGLILVIALIQTCVMFVLVYPEYYLNGDNKFYKSAYEGIALLPLFEGYHQFSLSGGSGSEPISFLVMFISSKFFSYKFYFYLSNVIFLTILGKLLSRLFDRWFLAYILLCFSFYIFIYSGLTQRLSIAVMFWMLCEMTNKVGWKRVLSFLSIGSHFQVLIVFGAQIMAKVFNQMARSKLSTKNFVLTLLLAPTLFILYGFVSHKIGYMSQGIIHLDAISILVWPLLLYIIGFRLKSDNVIVYMIIFFIALVISSGRLNIICFFYSIFLLQGHGSKLLYFTLLMMPYSLYQHVNYFAVIKTVS